MSSFLKSGTGKIVLGVGIIFVIMAGILIFQPGSNNDPPSNMPDINIITRHDITIQNAFTEAFLESDIAKDIGYTTGDTDKINFISASSLLAWEKGLDSDTRKVDLAWGGGPTLFNQMAAKDLLMPMTDQDILDIVNASVPVEIAGAQMRETLDGDLIWVANAISSFGFTINNDKLNELNLEKPTTWEDLASPDFFIDTVIPTVSLGNPTLTTSNTRIYQIIIQKFGWEKGWEILGRMAGNGNIYGGSVATRSAVIDGEVAVGMTIDFYGVFAQSDCADKATTCEYVIPTNGSIVNGDPIAFGAKGENFEGAKAFFEYVNSAQGQAVWMTLDRLPVNEAAFDTALGKTRPDVADLYTATLANQGIQFNETLATAIEYTLQQYFDSAIATPHTELKSAWASLVTALNDNDINQSEFDAKSAELFAPQFTIQEAIDNNQQLVEDSSYLLNQKQAWETAATNRYNSFSPTSAVFVGSESYETTENGFVNPSVDDTNNEGIDYSVITSIKNKELKI